MRRLADHPAAAWVLAAVALGLAAAGARPYAGGWNDGCRLAAVESLLERGTLAIDDSVFCKTPQHLLDAGHTPYPADRADLLLVGTLDKLHVRGHFHSDKPAVVSVLMAGMYQPLLWLGLPRPGERPDVFAWVMTVLTSGLGYAAAVGCLWVLGKRVGLSPGWRLVWLAGFALATYAPTYTRHVNNHAMQLGVVAGMCVLLLRTADATRAGRTAWGSLVGLGTLAGLAFNLDFGSGPLLVAFTLTAITWRTRRAGPVIACALAAAPWMAAGVGLNYAIGGVWLPLNMYPEHFDYPGSPFSAANLTGFSRHGPLDQLLYAGAMLLGKHGFLNHNLPLLLAATAGWVIFRRSFAGRAELLALLGWCAATWAVYAVLSNNMGGGCCSVRWFVPFLAPGFWVLAVLLHDRPEFRSDFVALAVWGAVLAVVMWWKGPWVLRMVPMMWPIVGAAVLTWGMVVHRRWRSARWVQVNVESVRPERRAA
ncbi:MAG TPA: hypothetical protein VKE74_19015 [Gemmataceae bacterium]|nr:hypothetical protein [Gemmataceae bacterium]